MYQHPIPQNISAYQFHLIGDLTLKQFFVLILGLGLAFLFFSSNLPGLIKYPGSALFLFVGVVGAFMPIEERPLDQWFAAFIKAVYRPTQFIWRRSLKEPEYFSFHTAPANLVPLDTPDMAALAIKRKREGLKSFLQTLPEQKLVNSLEQQEANAANSLTGLFSSNTPPLIPRASRMVASTAPINSLTPQTAIDSTTLPLEEVKPPPAPIRPTPHQIEVVPLAPVIVEHVVMEKPTVPIPTATPTLANTISQQPTPNPDSNLKLQIPRGVASAQTTAAGDASLPFPQAPTTPNTVVGMVLDKSGMIVENAIVEIRDQSHMPIRATKTNKLGQFFSTTPLKKGDYILEVEKAGLVFPLLKLEAQGNIIAPLKIQATS
jgi:hypothetical protein